MLNYLAIGSQKLFYIVLIVCEFFVRICHVLLIGFFLPPDHPGAKLSAFNLPVSNETQNSARFAYAALVTAKKLNLK